VQLARVKHALCGHAIIGVNMAKERTVSVTLRISEEVREIMHTAAEDEHRSMANMVEMLILQRYKVRPISVAPKRKSR
jgi:hypothetical protein